MPTTKNKNKPAAESREVPSDAFRMKIGRCQFAAADGDEGKVPFSMMARSAEPVMNWWFGAIYHDFSGMKRRDSIAVDYCHYDTEILGYADTFTVDEQGLHLAGAILPFTDGDRASEVAHKAKAGVPYEASIDFTGDDIVIEEVREGYTAEVNGQHVKGPCAIIREWSLRGVAICPHGMDSRTETRFSQTGKKTVIQLYAQSTMAKTSITGAPKKPASKLTAKKAAVKPAVKPQMAEGAEDEEKPDDEQAEGDEDEEEAPADDAADEEEGDEPDTEQDDDDEEKEKPEQKQTAKSRSGAAKELGKFTKRFGAENGTKWFVEGKSFEQAMSLHAKDLERRMAVKDAETEKLQKRLKQAKPGEELPSTFSEDGKEAAAPEGNAGDATKFSHLGGLSKFAASLKLPRK